MILRFESEVNRPLAAVSELMADPRYNKEWMEDLVSYESISGEPGMPGSTARLTFRSGSREMTFTSTVLARDLPNAIRSTLESPMVTIHATATFSALSPTTTNYVFEQDFHFHGVLNTILGTLAKSAMAAQQRRHMEHFKYFAERR
jgi:hypothetical protein